jgi:hypothetical protein
LPPFAVRRSARSLPQPDLELRINSRLA